MLFDISSRTSASLDFASKAFMLFKSAAPLPGMLKKLSSQTFLLFTKFSNVQKRLVIEETEFLRLTESYFERKKFCHFPTFFHMKNNRKCQFA